MYPALTHVSGTHSGPAPCTQLSLAALVYVIKDLSAADKDMLKNDEDLNSANEILPIERASNIGEARFMPKEK